MKEIKICLPDHYDDILSVCAIGGAGEPTMNATSTIVALRKCDKLTLNCNKDKTVEWIEEKEGE